MSRLEDLRPGVSIAGVVASSAVIVVSVAWHGADAVELTYKEPSGTVGNVLLYREDESRLELVAEGRPWPFDGDGALFRLVSEATRIRLAYLFDPLLAVHTSLIEPLPHQITAVYGRMLPQQPLRFLLADDPGAGKTIMAGLLIKELRARGDVERCLVCAPANLVEQWQDEMDQKFGLRFDILTREGISASVTGNPLAERDLVIARLDQMARADDILGKLAATHWDLVICDEAHKMSAHYYGNELRKTKRYELGERLQAISRHFLLMTATPHSGKDEDFGLFMRLLDRDRFEGRPDRHGAVPDASSLMRRMVKEDLVRFDRTPLFPERRAYTVDYELSPEEADLYEAVTSYVREEMNRVDSLKAAGETRRGNNVGFALTVLQRRLASSPEAIYGSLNRRRKRLEAELEQRRRQGDETVEIPAPELPNVDDMEELDDFYDKPEEEIAQAEEQVLDRATAARTVAELEREIEVLRGLEAQAGAVRRSRRDRKWEELSRLLQDNPEMLDGDGRRRKLIIFTEHRDTLHYLEQRISSLIGRAEAVVVIHGGLRREIRREIQERFLHDPHVCVLVATDAAGEGVNLQRAHLMINYDLPWNPNRIEQRFGRIHRIGQTQVCHLWNLVAGQTREGAVYECLLRKLEAASKALGGRVFDVLGQMFEDVPLRELLIEAIRYGEDPEVLDKLHRKVESPFDPEAIQRLLREYAIAADHLSPSDVQAIRDQMERAEARRLQPHYIKAYFAAAFHLLGGVMREREAGRYEVVRVPPDVRNRPKVNTRLGPVLQRYERVCFEKARMVIEGKPPAVLICPGHPLLDAVTEVLLDRHRDLLQRGAVLVDEADEGDQPRALIMLEHEIVDGRMTRDNRQQVVSRKLVFVEITPDGQARDAGYAPYLNCRPLKEDERALVAGLADADWLGACLQQTATSHAIAHLVPAHMGEVRPRVEAQVDKTLAAVRARLTTEITYWDRAANELKDRERAGKPARLASGEARRRADELEARLKARQAQLAQQRQLSPRPPAVVGAALIAPAGLLKARATGTSVRASADADARKHVERLAVEKVMAVERALGREPTDVGVPGNPWDIESVDPSTGERYFIEVKGRVQGADTICVTRTEILTAFNRPDHYILAIVLVEEGKACEPNYIRRPFGTEPDFAVMSVNYNIGELVARGGPPS